MEIAAATKVKNVGVSGPLRADENVESFAALVDAGFDEAVVRRRETGPGLVVQLVAAERLRRGSGGRARDGRSWV
jgi:hypothetical protein